jgi:hypothetical protein
VNGQEGYDGCRVRTEDHESQHVGQNIYEPTLKGQWRVALTWKQKRDYVRDKPLSRRQMEGSRAQTSRHWKDSGVLPWPERRNGTILESNLSLDGKWKEAEPKRADTERTVAYCLDLKAETGLNWVKPSFGDKYKSIESERADTERTVACCPDLKAETGLY